MQPEVSDVRRRSPARTALIGAYALGAALLMAGCASSKSPAYSGAGARVAAPVAAPVKIDVEDDGVPAQSPPVRRATTEVDDPSEPYSRNYGSRRPAAAVVRQPLPAQPVPTRIGYDRTFDADGALARAIAAREARVQ